MTQLQVNAKPQRADRVVTAVGTTKLRDRHGVTQAGSRARYPGGMSCTHRHRGTAAEATHLAVSLSIFRIAFLEPR